MRKTTKILMTFLVLLTIGAFNMLVDNSSLSGINLKSLKVIAIAQAEDPPSEEPVTTYSYKCEKVNMGGYYEWVWICYWTCECIPTTQQMSCTPGSDNFINGDC